MAPALTPRRWAVVRALLDVLTTAEEAVPLVDLAAACPPRLEYLPCYGHHSPGRGVLAMECDGDTHRVIRDSDTISIQAEIDLLRSLDLVRLIPRSKRTRNGGAASLYAYEGPPADVDDLMHSLFRWQPPRRPKGCPEDDDTYLDFYPDPAKEVLR